MNNKLITALRTAAKALEDGTFGYNFNQPESCNCGVLACTLLGKSANDLPIPKMPKDSCKYWANIVGHHCPVTGIPSHQTIRAFFDAGLVQKDIIELENLSNPQVLSRLNLTEARVYNVTSAKRGLFGIKYPHRGTVQKLVSINPIRDNKSHAIAYMRAWADLLVEQGQLDMVPKSQITTNAEKE